jgi:TorA maturation chaperone TorD
MAPDTFAAQLESPITRAVGYALLAHCFAYPDEARISRLHELVESGNYFLRQTPLAQLADPARRATPELLRPGFNRIFGFTASPDCPTYETAYIDTDMMLQAGRMARLRKFYELFGIESPVTGFRPDDLSVELEFMAFLARKEIYAREHLGAPRVAQVRRAQRLFLAEHLGCWAPALGRRVVEKAEDNAFYLRVGTSLEDWIGADCTRLVAIPVRLVDGPQLPEKPLATHGPEFAGAPQIIGLDDISEVT